jgi:serine/threonine-protein kinase RsbW
MPDTNLSAVEVTLVVLATNDHISFARLNTTAVAGKVGFDYDAIEDVRIAVSELCGTVIACAAPDSELRLDIRGGADGLEVSGRATMAAGATLEPDELSDQVLKVVSDEYSYDVANGEASFRMTRAARSDAE